jgi:hypothetical protein
VDSQPHCDGDLVSTQPLPAQYDPSGIYGYMDEHKKAMIQQWVEGQARGGPSVPPQHLTGVESLAWLQERAGEQAGAGAYTALTQFKVASSSASSCSSSPGETLAVVEVERAPEEEEAKPSTAQPEASLDPEPARCSPPPPPGLGGAPEEDECLSKASSGSRGSSRRSDVGTTTEGLPAAARPPFDTKLQDPFGAPRRVALPRASPEHQAGRTLEEVYQHCEALVETLSQASEELRAREAGEEGLRLTGIDDIEIYSVEEGSEGSVEVRAGTLPSHPIAGFRMEPLTDLLSAAH